MPFYDYEAKGASGSKGRGTGAGTRQRPKKNAAAVERANAARAAAAEGAPAPPVDIAQFALKPLADAPKRRHRPGEPKLPKAARDNTVLRVPGAKFIQKRHLPAAAQAGVSATQALLGTSAADPYRGLVSFEDRFEEGVFYFGSSSSPEPTSRHRRRRQKQHQNWQELMTERFMCLYLDQKHGRANPIADVPCECRRRALRVVLADWDKSRELLLHVCACMPAAEQLLALGYFPCAPRAPSIAFSTALLDFVSIHSLNVAPNVTAWAETLQTFWMRTGKERSTTTPIRKRLGSALTWYQALDNRAEVYVTTLVARRLFLKRLREDSSEDPRPTKRARLEYAVDGDQSSSNQGGMVVVDAGALGDASVASTGGSEAHGSVSAHVDRRAHVEDCVDDGDTPSGTSHPTLSRGADKHAQPAAAEDLTAGMTSEDSVPPQNNNAAGDGSTSSGGTPKLSRPTNGLRQKCPLCFGGSRPALNHTKAHVIVCLDANFSQKRRKCAAADPALEYLDGRFVPEPIVDAMEADVEERRKGKPKTRTRGTSARVPDHILDECEESFLAAQETVAKASKNYYAETGLMALLCRHDRVLWVVNLTSPGERQHYALTLLRQLGKELPEDWHIGVLYDIACQLSRSIEKWDFLSEISDRLVFGVSVFHAYGHQWACQVVFHPRKRDGFGLTDGEGCERFWSAIRHLIAGLRVSGFYRRLFILNRQVGAMDTQARWKFGLWLKRRFSETDKRLQIAASLVKGSGVPEEELGQEWVAQVEAQLVKVPRQNANAGDKAIDQILVAMGLLDDLKQQTREDRTLLRKAHKLTAAETQTINARLASARRDVDSTQSRIAELNAALGTEQCRRLEALRGNAYLCARVNARAIRANIRQCLQAHKFERRKLERAYRHQVLQAKEHSQTKDLVHRRERNISAKVRKYNALVDQMVLLARQGKKPSARTRLPRRLDAKKLFRLDVDDEIWQEDPGLGPQDEKDLPRWQTDDNVRRGIAALLEKRRCIEELERLQAEVRALVSWWKEEEQILQQFCGDRAQSATVLRVVESRLVTHRKMRDVWTHDLATCSLGAVFDAECKNSGVIVACVQDATHAAVDGVVASPSHVAAPASPARVADRDLEDVDSDDASDAYSSEEDEDEPVAELLDELECDEMLRQDEDVEVDARELAADEAHTLAQAAEGSQVEDVAMEAQASQANDVQKRRLRIRTVFRAGNFVCDAEDLKRMESRHAWLSGDGLSVFAQAQLLLANVQDVSVCHSRLLYDVAFLHDLDHEDDCYETQRRAAMEPIDAALAKLARPDHCRKWLVIAHVASPPHWTLLEIRWAEHEIRFYDSFARVGGYALQLERRTRDLISLARRTYSLDFDEADFRWLGETRAARQDNGWDCGPFVAADVVSLLTSDVPSTKAQSEMGQWRKEMVQCVAALRVEEEVVKAVKASRLTVMDEQIMEIDD